MWRSQCSHGKSRVVYGCRVTHPHRPVARFISNVIDCAHPERLAGFWSAMLGGRILHESASDDWVSIRGVPGLGYLSFQRVPEGKRGKNRVHMDIDVASIEVGDELRAEREVGLGPGDDLVERPAGERELLRCPHPGIEIGRAHV